MKTRVSNSITKFRLRTTDFIFKKSDAYYRMMVIDISIVLYICVQGSLNKFPDFFRMGTFIESTHMKLYSSSK